jgi:hypothetical protein
MKFQKKYLIAYNDIAEYPQQLTLDYNIWEYLTFNQPLVPGTVTYDLDFPEDKNMSFPKFLELFYFARRRNFGKATVDIVGVENAKGTRRGAGAAKSQGSFSVKKKLLAT